MHDPKPQTQLSITWASAAPVQNKTLSETLHSSQPPTGSGIQLPIIIHYCWQLQSLAGLRGDWPDCRGVGRVAAALPTLSTQRLSGQ